MLLSDADVKDMTAPLIDGGYLAFLIGFVKKNATDVLLLSKLSRRLPITWERRIVGTASTSPAEKFNPNRKKGELWQINICWQLHWWLI